MEVEMSWGRNHYSEDGKSPFVKGLGKMCFYSREHPFQGFLFKR
jgi:hypothetical protein